MIPVKKLPTIRWQDIKDEFLASGNKSFNLDEAYSYIGFRYNYIQFEMEFYTKGEYWLDEGDSAHNELVGFLREHLPPEYKDAKEILIYCD